MDDSGLHGWYRTTWMAEGYMDGMGLHGVAGYMDGIEPHGWRRATWMVAGYMDGIEPHGWRRATWMVWGYVDGRGSENRKVSYTGRVEI